MLKSIKFKGGFFNEETDLELFLNENRLSFIYGKNGSGKSTISKAMLKAKGETVNDIEQAFVYDQNNSAYTDIQCIHIFNEDYINSRVRIQDDGLNTIVLLDRVSAQKGG